MQCLHHSVHGVCAVFFGEGIVGKGLGLLLGVWPVLALLLSFWPVV